MDQQMHMQFLQFSNALPSTMSGPSTTSINDPHGAFSFPQTSQHTSYNLPPHLNLPPLNYPQLPSTNFLFPNPSLSNFISNPNPNPNPNPILPSHPPTFTHHLGSHSPNTPHILDPSHSCTPIDHLNHHTSTPLVPLTSFSNSLTTQQLPQSQILLNSESILGGILFSGDGNPNPNPQ